MLHNIPTMYDDNHYRHGGNNYEIFHGSLLDSFETFLINLGRLLQRSEKKFVLNWRKILKPL